MSPLSPATLSSVFKAIASFTDADEHARDAALWFVIKLAAAKNKTRAFLPLAEQAAARMTRKMTFSTLRKSTPVRSTRK